MHLQGYHRAVNRLLESVGYLLPESQKEEVAKQAAAAEQKKSHREAGNFETLEQCSEVGFDTKCH